MFKKRHLDAISEIFGIDPILDIECLRGCGICFTAVELYEKRLTGRQLVNFGNRVFGEQAVAYETSIDTVITGSVLYKYFVEPNEMTANKDFERIYFGLAIRRFAGYEVSGIGFDMHDKKLWLYASQRRIEIIKVEIRHIRFNGNPVLA